MKTTYTYDQFGNVTVSGESSDNPFQYTGRENDGTGLYYYRARYYSPELQRFINEDPILKLTPYGDGTPYLLPYLLEEPQELYHYVYGYNNPLRYVDPQGYLVLDTVGKFIMKRIGKYLGKKFGDGGGLITEDEEKRMLEDYEKKHKKK